MNQDYNPWLMARKCAGWTPAQIERMKLVGMFPAKRVRWFGKTHFMSNGEYKAMMVLLAAGGLIFAVSIAYVIGRMARPGGWQAEAWPDVSDGRTK